MYAILSLKIIKWKVGVHIIMGFDNDSIVKLLTDYGITIVISGLFIYVVVRLINMGLHWAENRLRINTHDENIEIRSKVGSKIQYLINQFLSEHDGHRLQVIEFSNSVMSIAYLPFRYMTCTYEVNTFDLTGRAKMVDKLSTSLFTQFFDNMQDEKFCEFDISNHNKLVGGAMYDLMTEMGEHKCICAMMKTAKGLPIGYIAFYKNDPFTDKDRQDIDNLASSIQALLCVAETRDIGILN